MRLGLATYSLLKIYELNDFFVGLIHSVAMDASNFKRHRTVVVTCVEVREKSSLSA